MNKLLIFMVIAVSIFGATTQKSHALVVVSGGPIGGSGAGALYVQGAMALAGGVAIATNGWSDGPDPLIHITPGAVLFSFASAAIVLTILDDEEQSVEGLLEQAYPMLEDYVVSELAYEIQQASEKIGDLEVAVLQPETVEQIFSLSASKNHKDVLKLKEILTASNYQ